MYYLIKGISSDEFGGSFEWVLEAESEDAAKAQLMENEICEEIREISVEERIEREEKALSNGIKGEYLYRRYKDCPIKEYAKYQKEMETNPEIYYKALVEFNKMNRLIKRLARRNGFETITMAKFFETVNKLIDAKTEEEFNTIVQGIV